MTRLDSVLIVISWTPHPLRPYTILIVLKESSCVISIGSSQLCDCLGTGTVQIHPQGMPSNVIPISIVQWCNYPSHYSLVPSIGSIKNLILEVSKFNEGK